MKVFLSCLLLASLTAPIAAGTASSPIHNLREKSTLECSNGRKFTVADTIYLRNLVCVKGVNEVKEADKTPGSASSVKATVETKSGQPLVPSLSASTAADHKGCYSAQTLYVVKVAPKEVIDAEVKILTAFGPSNDFAELIGYGHQGEGLDRFDFYIATRYGPNIERVFGDLGKTLSVGTLLGIAADIMDHFEVLHNHRPQHVVRKFDISSICVAGKPGSKHKVYLTGFRSIEQHDDHGKGSEKPTTTGSAKLKAKHSAVIDIKSLADTLVYFSRKDRMSLSIFKKKNAGLKGEEPMKHWIGEHERVLYPFVKAAYDLKPGDSIDHAHLKGLLPKHTISWDWETKKLTFQ